MRIASGIMFVLLLFCVAVQYNDPDPLRWMLPYGAAAALSALAVFRRYTPVSPALFLLYVGVAVYLLPSWSPGRLAFLLQQPKMIDSDHDIELARESVGLLIAAVWMAVLTWAWWKERNTTVAVPEQA